MAGRSNKDLPKTEPLGGRLVGAEKHLYITTLVGRALKLTDDIRASHARPGSHDQRTKYTVSKLAVAIGVHYVSLKNWLYRKSPIPTPRLDQLCEHMEFDVLDLLEPNEIAEVFYRRGKNFRLWVERNCEARDNGTDVRRRKRGWKPNLPDNNEMESEVETSIVETPEPEKISLDNPPASE